MLEISEECHTVHRPIMYLFGVAYLEIANCVGADRDLDVQVCFLKSMPMLYIMYDLSRKVVSNVFYTPSPLIYQVADL